MPKTKFPELNSKEWLVQKYWVENFSTREIGKILNCSYNNINYALKKFNIPIKTKSQALCGSKNPMYGKSHTEETKQKLSSSIKELWQNEEYKQKISQIFFGENNPNYGNVWTDEQKANNSKKLKEYYKVNEQSSKGKTFEEIYGIEEATRKKKILKINGSKRVGKFNSFYGKTHSIETRILISNGCFGKFRGEKASNWQGGKTKLNFTIRGSTRYKQWRLSIFERDSYTCQFCSKIGGNLHVDHIKPFSVIMKENNISSLEMAERCEELWQVSNGRTLCIECHQSTDTFAGKVNKFNGDKLK